MGSALLYVYNSLMQSYRFSIYQEGDGSAKSTFWICSLYTTFYAFSLWEVFQIDTR